MSAVPIPDPVIEDTRVRILLPGDLPSPANHRPAVGSTPAVRTGSGPVVTTSGRRCGLAPGHTVACHWAEDIAAGLITPRADAVVVAAVDEQPPGPSPRRVGYHDSWPATGRLSGQPAGDLAARLLRSNRAQHVEPCCTVRGHSAASTPTTPANRTKTTS